MRRKLIIGTLLIFVALFVIGKPYYTFLTKTLGISLWQTLFTDGGLQTVEETVTILILGIPGGTHDGPLLSDSITVLQYDFKKNTIVTIGIPRDVWSATLQDKINTAYAYGEEKQKGGGLKLAKAEVAGIIGHPVQYGAVISFAKFEQLIDFLGGVDVPVERSFIDKEFPIPGREDDLCDGDEEYRCRYQTLSFQKGMHHMDGATALKFVRSRHAEGDEGSDFARSRRQQLVMSALKDELIGQVKSLRIEKISALYRELDKLVERDITNQQAAAIAKSIVSNRSVSQQSFSLPEELFTVPPADEYYGKYVLIPQGTDFSPVHAYIQCILKNLQQDTCTDLIPKNS